MQVLSQNNVVCRAHWVCRPLQQELAQLLLLQAPATPAPLALPRLLHGPTPPCTAPDRV